MAKRAMNNTEKSVASELKRRGFSVEWVEMGGSKDGGGYYARHEKLVGMYHVGSVTSSVLQIADVANFGT